jgi:hypothetical protein
MASLAETCKPNGADPRSYLADVITRIVGGHPQSRLDELLPWDCPVVPGRKAAAQTWAMPRSNGRTDAPWDCDDACAGLQHGTDGRTFQGAAFASPGQSLERARTAMGWLAFGVRV